MLRWSFFFLPICLYAGIAGQAAGLYLFALLIPTAFCIRSIPKSERDSLANIGFFLLASWLLFPLTNLLNSYVPLWDQELLPHHSLRIDRVLKSQLSSTWFVSAVWLVFITKVDWFHDRTGKRRINFLSADELFKFTLYGFLAASLIAGPYFLFQHITGFDFRREGFTLGAANMMGDRYRVFGFYGHPLSVAGVSLALFAFFSMITVFGPPRTSLNFGAQKQHSYKLITAWVALFNFAALFMSGGRTSIVIGICMLFYCLLMSVRRILKDSLSSSRISALAYVLVPAVIAIVFVLESGIGHRFVEAVQQVERGHLSQIDSRFVFWEVYLNMIEQNPYYGYGAQHLSGYLREAFYAVQGLANFERKYNAHNIYLEILANIGVVGMLILSFAIFSCYRTVFQWTRDDDLLKSLFTASLAALAVNALHGLTQNVFYDASVLVVYLATFWIMHWMFLSMRMNQQIEVPRSPIEDKVIEEKI